MTFKPLQQKPDFPKLEEEILKFWEDEKIFQKSLKQTENGKPFTFYDGPPFATGLPHYGHILASTIKDVIPRYQTMRGRFVRRRWGWDTHGLPIEELVERELKISGKKDIEKLGIEKFNEKCRSMVLQFVDDWRKMVRRTARWVDFDNSYKTMDRDYMESTWWAFKQVYDKGLVYEGRKVLLYCPRCETPISNFEVAMDNSYETITEEAVIVKFKIQNSKFKNTYLLAWTTTPWTLIGNVALAVGKDIDYVKVKFKDDYYILAKDQVSSVIPDSDPESRNWILNQVQDDKNKFKGSDLLGLEYESLFDVPAVASDKTFRVYEGDFVTTEEGTGIVHTAVVYGEEDYTLGLKYDLPVVPLLDEKGVFNSDAPEFIRGQYFKKAEKAIKEDLVKRGLMFEKKSHKHSYPHCWRCGTALYYNAIPAWFINIQKIKKDLLKSNKKKINWFPEHLKFGRYEKSVEAAPDWNISRNRYWGNPIPVWKCEDCQKNTVVGSIEELGLKRNTFYFSRHGEAEHNLADLASSYPEKKVSHLTKQGEDRARVVGEKLKKLGGVDVVYSSDLQRAQRTAQIISELSDCEIHTDPRLREMDFGELNGTSMSQLKKNYPYPSRWNKPMPGGEDNNQVQARMVSMIDELNQKYHGKKILIVSHGDPLWTVQQCYGSEKGYPQYAEVFEVDVSIRDVHRPYIDDVVLDCKHCGGKARRVTEIFDSWVEAGSMPFSEYHYPFENKKLFESRFPAQFVAEYIAQTRAWFYVMHVMSQTLFKQPPFENVVTTGNVLNDKGEKLSKSKKNYTDPWEVIEKYGVDSLRFYLMNSTVMHGDDLYFSEQDLSVIHRKNSLIIWNVLNYFITYANEANWEPGHVTRNMDHVTGSALDWWINARTQELINSVTDYLDQYDTVRATKTIEAYVNDLSTWYVRRSRGRKDQEFFSTLYQVLLTFSKVIAPVMPYMAERIHRALIDEKSSVHLTKWPESKKLSSGEQDILLKMRLVREIVEEGHSQRKTQGVKVRQPLASLTYSLKDKKPLGEELEQIIASEMNVKLVEFNDHQAKRVEIDWELTLELKQEGLARDLERFIQDLRKKQDLRVGQMVSINWDVSSEGLSGLFDMIDKKKTYVSNLKRQKGLQGKNMETEEGTVTIEIEKA